MTVATVLTISLNWCRASAEEQQKSLRKTGRVVIFRSESRIHLPRLCGLVRKYLKWVTRSWLVTLPPFMIMKSRTDSKLRSFGTVAILRGPLRSVQRSADESNRQSDVRKTRWKVIGAELTTGVRRKKSPNNNNASTIKITKYSYWNSKQSVLITIRKEKKNKQRYQNITYCCDKRSVRLNIATYVGPRGSHSVPVIRCAVAATSS